MGTDRDRRVAHSLPGGGADRNPDEPRPPTPTVENVTDRRRNPFGVRYPCETEGVSSFGDANADVHLIGDHPGVHGGAASGVPFDGPAAEPLRSVLRAVGLATGGAGPAAESVSDDGTESAGAPPVPYVPENLFCSYLFACVLPGGRPPTAAEYDRLEPSFDAELRAVAAHVLLPVGDRAFEHVLAEYTSKADRIDADAARHHATEVPGRGFLVVPVRDPGEWDAGDGEALRDRLAAILATDYRRTADLGRFFPGDDAYLVR